MTDPRQEAARTAGVEVDPFGILRDAHGPLDPATAESEIAGHGGWRRGVVGVGVGVVAGLLARVAVRSDRPTEGRHPGVGR